MRILRNLLAVAALVVPALAFGQIVTPATGGTTTGSDVFLIVTNQTTFQTEVIDLGISANALPTLGSTTWHVDPNLISNMGTGTITYQVFAGIANSYASTLFTTLAPSTSFPTVTGNSVSTMVNTITGTWLSNQSAGFATNTGYLTYYSTAANTSWVTNGALTTAPGLTLGVTGVNAGAAVGTAMSMYELSNGTRTGAPTQTQLAGTWTLSGSTLSFAAATQTPLPAAAWLLVSGLLGLGAVGRRRVAA